MKGHITISNDIRKLQTEVFLWRTTTMKGDIQMKQCNEWSSTPALISSWLGLLKGQVLRGGIFLTFS